MSAILARVERYLLGPDGGKIGFGFLLGASVAATTLPPLVYDPQIAALRLQVERLTVEVNELKTELAPYREEGRKRILRSGEP